MAFSILKIFFVYNFHFKGCILELIGDSGETLIHESKFFSLLDKVGQSWTKLDKVGQSWTKLDKVGQSWTKLDKIN